MGESEFAAGKKHPPDYHREDIFDPWLGTRIEDFWQTKVLGQSQERCASPIFLGFQEMEGGPRIGAGDGAAEGCLNELETLIGKAANTSVGLVLNLAVLAEARPQEPKSSGSLALDFEVNRGIWFQDGYVYYILPASVKAFLFTRYGYI
jgi:hypothetical protein